MLPKRKESTRLLGRCLPTSILSHNLVAIQWDLRLESDILKTNGCPPVYLSAGKDLESRSAKPLRSNCSSQQHCPQITSTETLLLSASSVVQPNCVFASQTVVGQISAPIVPFCLQSPAPLRVQTLFFFLELTLMTFYGLWECYLGFLWLRRWNIAILIWRLVVWSIICAYEHLSIEMYSVFRRKG